MNREVKGMGRHGYGTCKDLKEKGGRECGARGMRKLKYTTLDKITTACEPLAVPKPTKTWPDIGKA